MKQIIDTLKLVNLEAINPDMLRHNRCLMLHLSQVLTDDREHLYFILSQTKAVTAYYNLKNGRKCKGICGQVREKYTAEFWSDMEKAGFSKELYYHNHHFLFNNNSKSLVKVKRDNPLLSEGIVKNSYNPKVELTEEGKKKVVKPAFVQKVGELEMPYYASKKKETTGDQRLYSSYNRGSKLCRAIVADLQGVDEMTELDGKAFAIQTLFKETGSVRLMSIIESGLPYGVDKDDKDYDKRKKSLIRQINILASSKNREDLRIKVRVINNGKYETLTDKDGNIVYRTDKNGNYVLAKSTEEKKAAALRWLGRFFDTFYKPQGATEDDKTAFLAVCQGYSHKFLTEAESSFREPMKLEQNVLNVHDGIHVPSDQALLVRMVACELTSAKVVFDSKQINTLAMIEKQGEVERHKFDHLRKDLPPAP